MRLGAVAGILALSVSFAPAQDASQNFAGNWKLNFGQSSIASRFDIPTAFLSINQTADAIIAACSVHEGQPAVVMVYPTTGKPGHGEADGLTFTIATKWEGAALMASVIVGGRAEYTYFERWTKAADGKHLTIIRTTEDSGAQVESNLSYDYWGVAPPAPAVTQRVPPPLAAPPQTVSVAAAPDHTPAPIAAVSDHLSPPPQERPELIRRLPAPAQVDSPNGPEYVLPPGTRILLRMTNSVNTARTMPGDKIYLQTAFPVFASGKLVIPPGSYVTGVVTDSQRAGRVKGKSDLSFRFESLTLPNGTTRDFRSRPGSVDAGGRLDGEGKMIGESAKGKDVATIARTTTTGAGIGGLAGVAGEHGGMGVGIGAAAGAAAGLAAVLSSRGPDLAIPQGTTMEMVLDRELRFSESELVHR
jgi:type IV secretion system protein VirB10